MRTRTLALAAVSLGLLVGCARAASPGSPTADGGTADTPVSSDIVKPAGGDRRIGEPWYLVETSLSSLRMPEGVTLTFEADTVGGQAPVNAWSAEYTATDAGGLELGPIASARVAGTDAAMRAEEGFFALLDTVDGYTAVEAGQLYLFDDQAEVLVFSATPQRGEPTVSEATIAVAEDVVGMSEEKAEQAVEDAGLSFRVVSRDG